MESAKVYNIVKWVAAGIVAIGIAAVFVLPSVFHPKEDVNPDVQIVIPPEMLPVEGGTFKMGDADFPGSLPVHEATVGSFLMSKYELTFYEFIEFCTAAGLPVPDDYGYGTRNMPVIFVNWYDAVEYCNWRSAKEGLRPCYTIDKARQDPRNADDNDPLKWVVTCDFSAGGYRLPTEAEWEYAARGGRLSKGYKYPGSDDLASVAWYYDNSPFQTKRIGQKLPNELGLHDMAGNVLEWCWDWYAPYPASGEPERNPTGPAGGVHKVFRGGGWHYNSLYCLPGTRWDNSMTWPTNNIGFRVVRTASAADIAAAKEAAGKMEAGRRKAAEEKAAKEAATGGK